MSSTDWRRPCSLPSPCRSRPYRPHSGAVPPIANSLESRWEAVGWVWGNLSEWVLGKLAEWVLRELAEWVLGELAEWVLGELAERVLRELAEMGVEGTCSNGC